MPIDCRNFENIVPDYEWLDAELRNKIDNHAENCPDCRRKFMLIQSMDDVMVNDSSDCPDFSGKIMNKISSEQKSEAELPVFSTLAAAISGEAILLILVGSGIGIGLAYDGLNIFFDTVYSWISEAFSSAESMLPSSGDIDIASFTSFDLTTVLFIISAILLFVYFSTKSMEDRRISRR